MDCDSVDRTKLPVVISAPATPTMLHPNLLIRALAMGAKKKWPVVECIIYYYQRLWVFDCRNGIGRVGLVLVLSCQYWVMQEINPRQLPVDHWHPHIHPSHGDSSKLPLLQTDVSSLIIYQPVCGGLPLRYLAYRMAANKTLTCDLPTWEEVTTNYCRHQCSSRGWWCIKVLGITWQQDAKSVANSIQYEMYHERGDDDHPAPASIRSLRYEVWHISVKAIRLESVYLRGTAAVQVGLYLSHSHSRLRSYKAWLGSESHWPDFTKERESAIQSMHLLIGWQLGQT